MKTRALVVDLDRCVGCFACEVACQEEHGLPADEKWIRVSTVGPGELNGELAADFLPLTTDDCDLCRDRLMAGTRPFCAEVCPTQALSVCGGDQLLARLRRGKRIQVCGLKSYEAGVTTSKGRSLRT